MNSEQNKSSAQTFPFPFPSLAFKRFCKEFITCDVKCGLVSI